MADFNNNFRNTYYNRISKSDINRKLLNKIGVPKSVKISDAKSSFDDCYKTVKFFRVGNELNKNQQKTVKTVRLEELYNRIIKF